MIVEGMVKSRSLAKEITMRWIRMKHMVYKKTDVMYEKYDVKQWPI